MSWVEIFDPRSATTSRPNSRSAKLSAKYGSTDKIDLWLGIIGERSVISSDLGEVGSRIVAAQFRKIRNADRLWHENVMAQYPGLLGEIKKTRLGDVIKRNSEVTTVNSLSFTKVV